MITQKTTEGTYQFQTAATINGRTRRAVPVLVTREDTGALYTVLVPTDGGQATCTCPHYQKRLKGTANAGCKHCSMALGHLLAEATPAPAAVSPTIIGQIEDPHAEARRDAERLW
jgi:hypothetical protein